MLEVPDAEKKYNFRPCGSDGRRRIADGQDLFRLKSRFGQEIFEGLGTSEMMYVFVSSVVTRKVKPGRSAPRPGYEIQVITEEGNVASRRARGSTRGANGTFTGVQRGRRKHAREAEIRRPGGLGAGRDFCTLDEEGYLSFVSRQEDLIKSSGYRSPEEVEMRFSSTRRPTRASSEFRTPSAGTTSRPSSS